MEILRKLGLPEQDDYSLSCSPHSFPDGADFRIEVPVVNSFNTFRALVKQARHRGMTVNRVTETVGLFRHTREELADYLRLAADEGITTVFSVGPRATYDTSPTRLTPHGSFLGYRLRGVDQIRRALDDVLRGLELGCRSFVVYDEGLLKTLGQARKGGLLPADTTFKASAHLGYANPISISMLEELGADSINPVRDLSLPAIAAVRQHIAVPLDVHTDNPPSSGGFIRTYEAPDIVRVARPVYLKTGNSVVGAHGQFTRAEDGERMADQASITLEVVQRFASEFTQSPAGAPAPVNAVSTRVAGEETAGCLR
ncbi:peptidase [Streptomyces aurantiacus]|uniref:peptidase n=1 Tax=Streptomyces aurantiacus TaxID=47760 RepID=UPI00216B1837|nr:peptidase [Streptomyces aurantiacus]